MRIILCKVGKKPEVKEIVGTLREIQQIVDGYIEVVPFVDGTFIVCNEEGACKNLPANVIYKDQSREIVVNGNCFICRVDRSEFASVTDEDIDKFINNNMVCNKMAGSGYTKLENDAIALFERSKVNYRLLVRLGLIDEDADTLTPAICDLAIDAIKEKAARRASEENK